MSAQRPSDWRRLGEGANPLLVERYPTFFAPHPSTRSFLLTPNDIIHAEVRKLQKRVEGPPPESVGPPPWLTVELIVR
jgi:hypothetical protein